MKTPFIGFDGTTLKNLPKVKAGDWGWFTLAAAVST